MLRAFAFAALIVLWFTLLFAIASSCVWAPMERGLEPAYVPGFAMAVVATLLLFVFWASVSWILRIAPVLAMSRGLGAGEDRREQQESGDGDQIEGDVEGHDGIREFGGATIYGRYENFSLPPKRL